MPILSRVLLPAALLAVSGQTLAQPKPPKLASREATEATRKVLAQAAQDMPREDGKDFEFASRGFIATWPEPIIRQSDGKPSFDLSGNDFIDGAAPDTVNPVLWRQNRVMRNEGLYRLAPGLYQARNLDNSNVSFIETPKILARPAVAIANSSLKVELRMAAGERPSVVATFCVGSISVALFTSAPPVRMRYFGSSIL